MAGKTASVHVKGRKPAPDGVHGHLEGCNRVFVAEGRCDERDLLQRYLEKFLSECTRH